MKNKLKKNINFFEIIKLKDLTLLNLNFIYSKIKIFIKTLN
jgi:hypothetical protein